MPIPVRCAVLVAGATRHYQATYRNSATFCTSATFNVTNGVRALWDPCSIASTVLRDCSRSEALHSSEGSSVVQSDIDGRYHTAEFQPSASHRSSGISTGAA